MPELGQSFPYRIDIQLSGAAFVYDLAEPTGMIEWPVEGPRTRNSPASGTCSSRTTCATCSRAMASSTSFRSNASTAARAIARFPVATPTRWRPGSSRRSTSPAATAAGHRRHRTEDHRSPRGYFAGLHLSQPRLDHARHRHQGPRRTRRPHRLCPHPLSAWRCARLRQFAGVPRTPHEGDPGNYSYPWRDNFCERRSFYVGQCPGGLGHQGQDIRPASCRQRGPGARCEPYQHDVVAVRDGMLMRAPGQQAVYVAFNAPNERDARALPAHAAAAARSRRHPERPPRARGRGHRQGRAISEGAKAPPPITCISTCRCRANTAGCSSIPT